MTARDDPGAWVRSVPPLYTAEQLEGIKQRAAQRANDAVDVARAAEVARRWGALALATELDTLIANIKSNRRP